MYSGKTGLTFSGLDSGGRRMKKIIADFRRGLERLRWFSSIFSERLRIEMAVIKLLFESDKVSRTRRELLMTIGERVIDLKSHHDKNILRDSVVSAAVAEIEKLDRQIDDIKTKVSEIGRVTD